MRYSLILHANGPEPKDYRVYINDSGHILKEAKNWWCVGLLQSIRFTARADSYIPSLVMSSIGTLLTECEKPDLSTGLVINFGEFAKVNEKPDFLSTTIVVNLDGEPLSGVSEIQFEADVKGVAHVRIEATKKFADWAEKLPDWVELKLKDA